MCGGDFPNHPSRWGWVPLIPPVAPVSCPKSSIAILGWRVRRPASPGPRTTTYLGEVWYIVEEEDVSRNAMAWGTTSSTALKPPETLSASDKEQRAKRSHRRSREICFPGTGTLDSPGTKCLSRTNAEAESYPPCMPKKKGNWAGLT
jgi:hypothetical protein